MKKSATTLFLILLTLTTFSKGLDSLINKTRFYGYYENQLFIQDLKTGTIFQDYNKVRFDLSTEITKKLSFNCNVNIKSYHGKTALNLFDFIPDNVANNYAKEMNSTIEDLRPMFGLTMKNEIILDNAYFSAYTKHANFRIGKQQLPWGTGYAWNPTDLFNDKNLLDPMYEKTGVNAFKTEIPFASEGMVTGLISVGDNWENTTKALKARYYISGFDFSISYAYEEENQINYFTFEEEKYKRQLFGGDVSGSILGVGIWAEGAYNHLKSGKNYKQLLIGADYTFMNGLYLMAEFYHNGLGSKNSSEYTFADWMAMLGAQGENLGKNYIFAGQLLPIGELVNWSNYFMINLNDKSGMIYPWFDFSLNDNVELILVGYVPFGKKGSEFAEYGMGGFGRLRVYF